MSTVLKLEPNTGLPLNPFDLITIPFGREFNGGSFHHGWTVTFIQWWEDETGQKCHPSVVYYVDALTGKIVNEVAVQGITTRSCDSFLND